MNAYDVSSKSLNELISLKGKTAVVTGGARGIGLAIVKRLAEAGANAGIYPNISALDIDNAAYDRLMDINLKGTFVSTRDAACWL